MAFPSVHGYAMTEQSRHLERNAMQHYSKKTDPIDQRLYLAQRIDQADARLQQLHDAAARQRCAQWITAWAVAAGADAPRGMKLRIRSNFILL